MSQDLTRFSETWKAPEKKVLFEGYKVFEFPEKRFTIPFGILMVGFFIMFFSAFFGAPEEVVQFLMNGYIVLFFANFIYFAISMIQVGRLQSKQADQRFFKEQDFYDDQTFISNARQTKAPYYHEVIKVERPDLSKAPPAFRDLPDADRLVFVETQELESSPADHQGATKWVLYLDPHQSIPIQSGDHLVSLYGEKNEDSYAVHAQSCKISPPKITIPPDSVLLSLKGYVSAITSQKEECD